MIFPSHARQEIGVAQSIRKVSPKMGPTPPMWCLMWYVFDGIGATHVTSKLFEVPSGYLT